MVQNSLSQRLADTARNLHKFHRDRRLSILRDDWFPAVASFAGDNVDRDLAEERHPEPLGFALATAAAENVVSLVIGRLNEGAHVFHQSDHRQIYFPKHVPGRG